MAALGFTLIGGICAYSFIGASVNRMELEKKRERANFLEKGVIWWADWQLQAKQYVTGTLGTMAFAGAAVIAITGLGNSKKGGDNSKELSPRQNKTVNKIVKKIIKGIEDKEKNERIDNDDEFMLGMIGLIEMLRGDECLIKYLNITKSEAKILSNNLENIVLKGKDILPNTIILLMSVSEELYSGRRETPMYIENVSKVIKMKSVKDFYMKYYDISEEEMKFLAGSKKGVLELM
jgi:hypothetical protein